MAIVRPRRSVLYMPGSNARALEKAKTLPADGLILDLEDACAVDKKELGREQVCAAVVAGGYAHRELIIRVNGLDSEWGRADLEAAAKTPCDAVLLPKVESGQQVAEALKILSAAGAPESVSIWCMMETPLGILQAAQIAGSSDRIGCLVMGTSDLTKDLHAEHTPMRLPMVTSLGLCLLAARAYGLAILDGVSLDLDDAEAFAASCVQGRELGFDGKTLIHPKQVAPCNEVFSPSEAAIAHSLKLIAAFEAAVAEGKNVCVVDGKLVENLHVENAKRLVTLSEAIAQSAL